MAAKVEMRKVFREHYTADASPSRIEADPGTYLAVPGTGAPGGPSFQECMGALYGLAYGIRSACKARGQDFTVAPPEALWPLPEGRRLRDIPPDEWGWTLLVRVPDFVTDPDVLAARQAAAARGKATGAMDRASLVHLDEGPCVQVLHKGPYQEEHRSIEALEAFMDAQGLCHNGPHHEVYLSDPGRTRPENLKTILRQPVRPVPP